MYNKYSNKEIDTLVHADKLKLLFQQSSAGVFISLISAAVLTAILWPVQQPSILLTWFALLFATSVARYFLFYRYRQVEPQKEQILAWERPYFITLSLTTLTWGLGSVAIMPDHSPLHQVVILCFMIGLTGGAIASYSVHSLVTIVTISILLIPVSTWFLFKGDLFSIELVFGAVIVYLASLRATRFIASTIHQNFLLSRVLEENKEELQLAATVFEHSQDGILITGKDGLIVDVNLACCEITGYTREEMLGKNPSMLSSGEHTDSFYRILWEKLRDSGQWQGEIWNRRKDGEIYAQRISIDGVFDEAGELQHYVAIFHDISYTKQHEAELEKKAYYDILTGLPNRLLLEDRLRVALKQSQRDKTKLAVCYLDLDEFKPINDNYGHHAGDLVLGEVADRIQHAVRPVDTVARIGGDEFIVLLDNYGTDAELGKILRRILAAIKEPCIMDFGTVTVTASIGVSLAPSNSCRADELLSQADRSMYIAKTNGRNGYRLYEPWMNGDDDTDQPDDE